MNLTIVIPCYNEEQVLPWTLGKLATLIDRLKTEASTDARLLLVDDGSRDRTWEIISEAAKAHCYVSGIRLSHNEGHQGALWAGMQESVATSDAVASIDADLQDDETAMIDMARQINDGKDIVYGVRKKRETDTWFKRFTAQSFYKLMKSMDSEIVYNHADFRMMSRRAVEALMQYPERNLFLRGIVRRLGFKEGFVYYDRRARELGESKYPLKKMLAFSIDGITSFSTAPLKFITFVGLTMTLVSLVMIMFGIIRHIEGNTIEGWTSLLVSLWFIGGIITTAMGVTGIYIGKIYVEVKQRPRYFVQERA
uniref:glycosyltransferase family 2 protein n=1 Tax=Prevotella sp. TaxID=59823 RepID=UPI003FEDC29E